MTIAAPDSEHSRILAEFCREIVPEPLRGPRDPVRHPLWAAVRHAGSALWLDSGDLEANRSIWTDEFSGFTTNNTLLNKILQSGLYDDMIPPAAALVRRTWPAIDDDDLLLELAFVVNAVHGLTLARRFGAVVCVELHTALARDVDASVAFGRRLHDVDPEHFVVKVPLTPEGLLAARRLEADGVRVNVTLGFSPRQNHLIARFARPHFVNVFLGRVNALCAQAGLEPGTGEAAAIASNRMLRDLTHEQLIPGRTRQIAASIRDGDQIATLAGIDVVTVPVSAAEAFVRSGVPASEITDRTNADPAAGRDIAEAEGMAVFHTVEPVLLAASEHLLARDPAGLTGDRVRAVLSDNYLADLFPELSAGEHDRIAADGKIPRWPWWRGRVRDGTASWDGLLTEAALASFAADQAEFDDRIRSCW